MNLSDHPNLEGGNSGRERDVREETCFLYLKIVMKRIEIGLFYPSGYKS
jgi:hypothetical protein